MMLWLLALFVTVALLILAFVIAYVLVSIYLRGGNSTRPLPKMSQVRGFIVRHTLPVFFIFLFAWAVVGTVLALRAG
jgi:Na+-driven multidrug efflux pump